MAEVREVGTHVGQAAGDQAVGSDSAEMWVTVESSDHGKTLAAIRRVVAGYTGLEHEVTTYSEKRMTEELGRASDEITVRIFGSDLGRLHDQAVAVKGIASKVDGVTSAREASQAAEPTMEVEVDLEKARGRDQAG